MRIVARLGIDRRGQAPGLGPRSISFHSIEAHGFGRNGRRLLGVGEFEALGKVVVQPRWEAGPAEG